MLEYIIVGLVALALGVLLGWILTRPKLATLKEKLAASTSEVERDAALLSSQHDQLDTLNATIQQLQVERSTLQKEITILKEQAQRDEEQRGKAFERQLQILQERLKDETRQILEQRAQTLSKNNNEQMNGVVAPLKEQLVAMQKQVNESLKTTSENRASIEKAIEVLVKHTEQMADEANHLARALKGENKTQGNWGEMILDTLLEQSGLEKGLHYETQVTLRDEQGHAISNDITGHRMIPDAIVHYPDGKDVIIDSKTSLSAYLDYCKAENDNERDLAAERHLISVRQHIKELRQKNYASYIKPPRQALQYMIMFIPNESAMQLAIQKDPTLWREAFESGICITSEQNLIVLLKMIQLAWTQVQQYQNQQEIIHQARTLLDRVQRFIDRFEKMNADIERLRNDYDEARRSFDGRQGILGAAKTMERLGAKSSQMRALPDPIENE